MQLFHYKYFNNLIQPTSNINFGTYLQTVALATLLQDKGYGVEVVHYVRRYLWFSSMFKDIVKFTKNPLRIANRTRHLLRFCLNRRRDWNFVRQHVSLTRRYCTFEELKSAPPKADLYMTGSDQVWNSWHNKGLDKSFYLAFAPKGKPKVAYSASIGMDDFQDFEKEDVFSMLSEYKSISVRESGAKKILDDLGIGGVEVTLDPTLMLPLERWNELIPNEAFVKKEKYLLVYSVESKEQNDIVEAVAKRVAKEKGLKTYSVSLGPNGAKYADRNFRNATPQMFISLLRQADFVVVSSFHGTAFSINFNKQFLTVTPERFRSRIDSILNICDLQNRKISTTDFTMPEALIDYEDVNKKINEVRMKSHVYIDNIL